MKVQNFGRRRRYLHKLRKFTLDFRTQRLYNCCLPGKFNEFMQTLVNALVNGTTEYKEDGTVVQHPPSAIMLRASRELTTLFNINATNQQTLNQLQLRVEEQLKEITILQEQNNEHLQTINKLTTDIQDLRVDIRLNGNEEVNSDVESGSEQSSGSDSTGQGSGTN